MIKNYLGTVELAYGNSSTCSYSPNIPDFEFIMLNIVNFEMADYIKCDYMLYL